MKESPTSGTSVVLETSTLKPFVAIIASVVDVPTPGINVIKLSTTVYPFIYSE